MAAPMVTCRKCKYLLHFAHEHLDFRLALYAIFVQKKEIDKRNKTRLQTWACLTSGPSVELKSVAGLFNIPVSVPTDNQLQNPFVVVDLPNEEAARKIASRTILVKSLFELWAKGSTYEELFSDLRNLPKHFTEPHRNGSFCIRLTSFNKQIPMVEKIKRIETLLDGNVAFDGKMNLKHPDNNFHLLEYYGANQVEPSEHPITIYFGRWIADGQRENIKTYHLQNRKFIGNTSMDATLGFIMANMGQVKPTSLVFDPFVGTGSLLIAGAHHGAYVMGTDIDYKLLHSRGRSSRTGQKWRRPDENIYENLRQYNLAHRFLDCLVADASQHSLWRQQPLFDAIVTDPPYGIREATNRVGTTKESVTISEDHKADHVPSKVNYHLSDILKDLLNFAAKYLTLHGRLTFWLPVYRPDYVDEHIPRHSCLHLVANSEQILNSKISRRLVTMEKVKEFDGELAEENATMPQDPYQGGTFREKYFTPNSKTTNERPRAARTTAARSAGLAGDTADGRRPTKTMRSQKQDDLSKRTDVSVASSSAADT